VPFNTPPLRPGAANDLLIEASDELRSDADAFGTMLRLRLNQNWRKVCGPSVRPFKASGERPHRVVENFQDRGIGCMLEKDVTDGEAYAGLSRGSKCV